MEVQVNYFLVFIAAVASMAVGYAWYHKNLFGKEWMTIMGYTESSIKDAQKKMGKMYVFSFIGALVMAFMLSHLMSLSESFYGYGGIMTGLTSAFFAWLGFVAPVQMTDVLFGGKPWKLFIINTGYQLTSLLLMGVVLSF